ncbi:MAG: response regulator [Deltaproteobacteria bacterium]|nr:response regulator [Deltaproteobacteria bacterium]
MDLKILIVDDDKKLLSVLKSILLEDKNEVTTSTDGQQAIDLCYDQNFDLIICDLMLPGADGLKVLREARKINPNTLVILITGFASIETAIQAIREGAYDYITKPFRLDEIKIVTNNAGEKIRLMRENQRLFMELQDAYKQLYMIKKAAADDIPEKETHDKSEDINRLFITGSLLPFYYAENRPGTDPPFLADLERLSALKEKGLLSEGEFNICKTKLLTETKRH